MKGDALKGGSPFLFCVNRESSVVKASRRVIGGAGQLGDSDSLVSRS